MGPDCGDAGRAGKVKSRLRLFFVVCHSILLTDLKMKTLKLSSGPVILLLLISPVKTKD